MANKNLQKANKIVTKATTAFSDTIQKVEKANDILSDGIIKDLNQIREAEEKIEELKAEIQETEKNKATKHEQMESNNVLIQQLSSFTPGIQ